MSDTRISAYAEAALLMARAEGTTDVEDELFRFARVLEGNEELRSTLTDQRLPAALRQQITEDVLGGRASTTTVAFVSMVVAAGRAGDLPKIADALVARSAASTGASVAEVRSAVALTDDQISRLAAALTDRLGQPVTVKNIVDPSVVGGVVTRIGDSVIDGTVRTRLTQLREAF